MPAFRWDGPGVTLTVRLSAAQASVGAEQFNPAAHFAIGIVALPVAVLNPPAAIGWPFYMVLGAPWQALFNARADTLVRALGPESLPTAVIDAVREQWRLPAGEQARQIDLQIQAYGLVTRSGKPLEAFAANEDLCLQTYALLSLQRDGAPARESRVAWGIGARTPGMPPPVCASMARWADHDGRRLREAVAQSAEILAAIVLQASEETP